MAWVRDWFNVLPLSEAASRLAQGTLPARALSITFDDGYADNREIAAPILQRLGLSATFFIATSFLGGGCMNRVDHAAVDDRTDDVDARVEQQLRVQPS